MRTYILIGLAIASLLYMPDTTSASSYVPKRILKCQEVFIGYGIDTQIEVNKKYHCTPLWALWTREMLLNAPIY